MYVGTLTAVLVLYSEAQFISVVSADSYGLRVTGEILCSIVRLGIIFTFGYSIRSYRTCWPSSLALWPWLEGWRASGVWVNIQKESFIVVHYS